MRRILSAAEQESYVVEESVGLEEEVAGEATITDPRQPEVQARLRTFLDRYGERIFFSKQIEVLHENDYYHWLTNRALRELVRQGILKTETRELASRTEIHLLWHSTYRYYRRAATNLVRLVNEYSDPNVGAALGLHGGMMVLEGFARNRFVMMARETNEYHGIKWTESDHDLDFVFERDGRAYGIEVKNTLKYMAYEEFRTKVRICRLLGIVPVFVCRMLPREWIMELVAAGGFALILKWQLYPWTHTQLAKRIHKELGLPVDSPRRLEEGTMLRFMRWHSKFVNPWRNPRVRA